MSGFSNGILLIPTRLLLPTSQNQKRYGRLVDFIVYPCVRSILACTCRILLYYAIRCSHGLCVSISMSSSVLCLCLCLSLFLSISISISICLSISISIYLSISTAISGRRRGAHSSTASTGCIYLLSLSVYLFYLTF